MMFESWEQRQAMRAAYGHALWLAIALHGSPVRIDVVRPAALRLIDEELRNSGIESDEAALAEVCTGRQASIAVARVFGRSASVRKVAPAVYLADRHSATAAAAALRDQIAAYVSLPVS